MTKRYVARSTKVDEKAVKLALLLSRDGISYYDRKGEVECYDVAQVKEVIRSLLVIGVKQVFVEIAGSYHRQGTNSWDFCTLFGGDREQVLSLGNKWVEIREDGKRVKVCLRFDNNKEYRGRYYVTWT